MYTFGRVIVVTGIRQMYKMGLVSYGEGIFKHNSLSSNNFQSSETLCYISTDFWGYFEEVFKIIQLTNDLTSMINVLNADNLIPYRGCAHYEKITLI